jgi:osmotically-inducible protein OsmY
MKTLLVSTILILLVAGAATAQPTDAQIRALLRQRIPTVDISVANGVVTLTGTASELAQKVSVETMARRTPGVRQVINQIKVVPPANVSDADIVATLRASYMQNLAAAEVKAITVQSSGGVVTLAGTLPSSYPKQLAMSLASFVLGVVDIRNQIVVKPPTLRTDAEILAGVKARFTQNPIIPAQSITETVTNGVVTLTGTVTSFLQADQAESVARFVPGVIDVRNNLFVSGG